MFPLSTPILLRCIIYCKLNSDANAIKLLLQRDILFGIVHSKSNDLAACAEFCILFVEIEALPYLLAALHQVDGAVLGIVACEASKIYCSP
jgi:hypothetical protein